MAEKVCTALKKDQVTGLGKKQCKEVLVDGKCPKRSEHLNKYRTGFCIDGNCEATSKQLSSGGYAKTCTFWLTCPCECHSEVSLMYSLAGLERKLPMQKYEPPHSDFVIPSREEVVREAIVSDSSYVVHESSNPEVPVRISKENLDGRVSLDDMVQACAEHWISVDQKSTQMTTVYVSEWCAKHYDIPAPSRGAIDSLFKRWESLGFAFIAKSPNRFAGFTKEGKRQGLLALKKLQKRERKFKVST